MLNRSSKQTDEVLDVTLVHLWLLLPWWLRVSVWKGEEKEKATGKIPEQQILVAFRSGNPLSIVQLKKYIILCQKILQIVL